MHSTALLRVAVDQAGVTRPVSLRGEVPQLLRVTHAARRPGEPLVVHLVGGGAGPLGGDDLRLHVIVEPGAHLVVRSAGATLVLPGPTGARSTTEVVAEVGAGASLDWWPEPLVACAGCDHVLATTVTLDELTSLRWVDEVVMGRSGEQPGALTVRQRITRAAAPLWCQELEIGPDALEQRRYGDARVVAGVVATGRFVPDGPPPSPVFQTGCRAAAMAITPTGRHWAALATTHTGVTQALVALGAG